jgi:hypothetical protein
MALVTAGLVAATVPASADVPAASADGVVDASHVADEGTALVTAVAYGHKVTVDSESSPTLLVQALPDGTMQTESDVVPARAKVGGVWTSIDTALQTRSDGWLEPKVAAAGVRFGPGGTDDIAQIQSESGQWFAEQWPYGSLPAPTIDGAHATYPEVFPGVDLRLTATDAGMSEVLVVKTAQAAQDPELANVTLAVQGATVQPATKARALQALTSVSADPVASATPLWWDSRSALSNADTPGSDEPQAVPTTSTTSSVSLNVQAVTASAAAPTYPLYIDPDWSSYLQADWYTDRAYPNQSYLDPPSDSVGYGISGGVGYLSHAFFQFQTDFLAGKHVLNARFNIHQTYANSCDTTLVQLWEYGGSTSPGFTWNTEPNQWWGADDQQGNANGGPCAPNPAWVGFSAVHAAAAAAANHYANIQLGMRVADESNSLTRKHYDWNAQLIVTYNTPPVNPASPVFTVPSRGCSTDATKPVYVNNGPTQPLTMQVTQADADGGNINDAFYVYAASGSTAIHTYASGSLAQGAVTEQIPAGTLSPGAYKWNARAGDYTDLSAGYSPYCYFTVINTGPPVPTITLPALAVGQSYTVGKPITVTIGASPSDHVAMFAVWWATGTTVTLPTTYAPGGAVPSCSTATAQPTVQFLCPSDPTNPVVTVSLAPPDTQATLEAASFDLAGNPTTTTPHAASQLVTAGSDTSGVSDSAGHRWAMDGLDIVNGTPSIVPDANTTASGVNLTVGATPSWASGSDGPSLSFPASSTASTASAAVNTTQSFTVSAFLTPTNVTAGQTFTALSHGTGADSDFTLGIANGHWQFCARVPGSPSATKPDCAIGSAAVANQDVFVTGTYDSVNKMASISFNGSAQSAASVTHLIPGGTTPSAGGLLVGADRAGSSTTHPWAGMIYDPSIYQGVASSAQLANLDVPIDPDSGL